MYDKILLHCEDYQDANNEFNLTRDSPWKILSLFNSINNDVK